MLSFKNFLGPEATKQQDKQEIARQKKHLTQKAKEYHDMSKDEGGGGMAQAHGDMFDNAKKAIHNESFPSVSDYKDRGTGKFEKKKDPTTGGTIHSVKYNKETGETDYPLKRGQHKQDTSILNVDTKPLSKVLNKKRVNEDGMGAVSAAPANSVAGVAGTGDSRQPASQREPGVSKKRNPTMGYFRRKPPKA